MKRFQEEKTEVGFVSQIPDCINHVKFCRLNTVIYSTLESQMRVLHGCYFKMVGEKHLKTKVKPISNATLHMLSTHL